MSSFTKLNVDEPNAFFDDIASLHKASMSTLTQNNIKKEEALQISLNEVLNKAESLKLEKNGLRANFQKLFHQINEKIKKNKEAVQKIDEKLQKIENKHQKIHGVIKSEKELKIEAFKTALQPLKNSAELIDNSKIQVSTRLDQLQKEILELNNCRENKLHEMQQKSKEIDLVNSNFIQLKKNINELKKQAEWDYKEVFVENKIAKKIVNLKALKKIMTSEMQALDLEISNENELIDKIEENKNYNTIDYLPDLKENEKIMLQLEEFLNLQSAKHNCPLLKDTIKHLSSDMQFCLQDHVLKEQVKLMENKEIEIVEHAKTVDSNFENAFLILDSEIKALESIFFDKIKNHEKNNELESTLKSKRDLQRKLGEEHLKDKRKADIWIMTLKNWLSGNRKFLLAEGLIKIPDDQDIITEFIKEFHSTNVDLNEIKAIESIINRYYETSRIRNDFFIKLQQQLTNNSEQVSIKNDELNKHKAIKKTKELEKEKLKGEIEKLVKSEKELLKDLENSKLEIDSGRKKMVSDYLNLAQASGKKEKKLESKALFEEIKDSLSKIRYQNVEKFRKMYEEKARIKIHIKALGKDINDRLNSEAENLEKEIIKRKNEVLKLEEDCIVLENTKEDLLNRMGNLAGKKKDEMIISVQRLAKFHGAENSIDIEKIYQVRSDKESEIIEFELELIKSQKILSEKELEKSLEILKLNAKIEAIKSEIKRLKYHKKKKAERLSMGEIAISDFIDISDFQKKNKDDQTISRVKSSKKEDSIRNSNISKLSYQSSEKNMQPIDFNSDISLEIPYPSEIRYTILNDCSNIERRIFESISSLLEGIVLYKKFQSKSVENFDPLEHQVTSPESCGFSMRKMKLNKQLTKIEVRHIGKTGVESNLMLDSIVSISPFSLTSALIKAQQASLMYDNSLEAMAQYSREYREMKYSGKINYSSIAFIAKAKDTHFYPFYLVLKTAKLEMIAESQNAFENFLNGITVLIKYKKNLEALKFKIHASPN
ncbi:hypothetical protein SteCoe_34947 [Stentor coeruleus]|uniref:Uncharacterized protein n=1 Tax=Stentor coeruleus TaxID=5963 RepID=A0A1R2ATI6_9CILI|nr:hypothetical protein SteCoe_34947 [Stentor coeruleus]